ncbi:ferric reductase [Scheffersomyces xylosifermentans]|uniref:ferric reductase n=1 Tax=Scheffersomyces xylosifermentans TaxID=1304137 RepID=UPI00315E0106
MDTDDPWLELWNNFHYPKGKSKPYKKLRQETTIKYSNITTIILIAFVLCIPLHRILVKKGYKFTNKFQVLRALNRRLNKYIYPSDELDNTHRPLFKKTMSHIASRIKRLIFTLSYHATTIFILLFWGAVLSTLSLVDLYHGDLVFLAARLGRVAAVCLPTILFLSLRPSPLPNTLYLTLIPIHKWLSRIIIIQSILHVLLYCGYFQVKGTWSKAIKPENIYGWVALTGFTVMMITSISKMRSYCYWLFYINHYFWSWVIVICLQFHVRPVKFTYYTAANLLILLGQIVYRVRLTMISRTVNDIKVIDVSPNISLVEFPNYLISNPARKPAAHIRLTNYHPNFIVRAFKQLIPNYHPYTLVSLPQDNYQKLIIRKSNFELVNNRKYLMYGSFDPHLLFIGSKPSTSTSPKFSISKLSINAKRVLIVIGGSAISFALPILRVMNYHGVPVKIVWVLKDFRDVAILKYFDGFIHGSDFEIFVTGSEEIKEERERKLRNSMSYGSILSRKSNMTTSSRLSSNFDLESNERSSLLAKNEDDGQYEFTSLVQENQIENVEVSMDNEEDDSEDDDGCAVEECSRRSSSQLFDDDLEEEEDHLELGPDRSEFRVEQFLSPGNAHSPMPSPSHSRKSSINEPFVPVFNQSCSEQAKTTVKQFRDTIKSLNIENKIYKGRPKLNYKYYNWCINEGFTQCSGPVEDDNHNLVCCKDLPKNKIRQEDINAEKIWVLSAGPKPLVDNVKLWANEYGLKFHEEAFYA